MVIGILMGIAVLLSILLVVDKNYHKIADKRKNIKEIIHNTTTELQEDDLSTELMETSQEDFDFKGRVLNGLYIVEGILGEGGMGIVYLCRNIKLGNLWAVKFLPHKTNGEARRTLAEEDILNKLNHIHLPQIVDIFEDEEGFYIVESYIAGVSLEKKFKEEGPFTEEQVLRWSRQLADVLIYIHTLDPHPIIYGDMKPSNVMITPDDGAVLIDFGVAMEYRGENNKELRGSKMGLTVKYSAPERFKGYADPRSDIYSLGVMMFYLLTGDFPDKDTSIKEQSSKISKEMIRVLEQCLKRDASQRYQSARELKEDLYKFERRNRGLFSALVGKPTFQTPQDYKKIIVLMSPESTGKTVVSVSLAWSFAEKGIKTILLDTDFNKKDAYYYFDKDFANCLAGKMGVSYLEPQKIRQNLSIFTDHRDVEIALNVNEIKDLILQSKRDAQVVIVDLGRCLKESTTKEILSLADHKVLVVDQRINLLNRLPKDLYINRTWLKDLDLVINRYLPEGYIKEKNIKGYFRGVQIDEEECFEVQINQIFTVREDYLGIIKGLEDRQPPVVHSKKLKEDMEVLRQYFYPIN